MNVKARIKDKTTIELLENASIGDLIDLNELQEIDLSNIEKIFNENKDKILQNRIDNEKENISKTLKLEYENQILEKENKLNLEIEKLKNEIKSKEEKYNFDLKKIELDTRKKDEEEINDLKSKILLLKNEKDNEIEIKVLKVDESYQKAINDLKNEHIININKQKDNYEKEKAQLNEKINELTFQKSIKNIKTTGEDLEAWCNNEVESYMQNGFLNCNWYKDNKVVKETDENKGSKADFIFEVYANSEKNSKDLLTNICLEMKDENPDSVNKKTNEDYYNQLDKNRNKKGCKYALLVSNLEMDKPNLLPIYKVLKYEDMYVCRPAYLMTFLNIIVSLTNAYSNLLIDFNNKMIELEDINKIKEDFNALKSKYLDKPLEKLESELNKISISSDMIKKQANLIDEACNQISSKYISDIRKKLDNFNISKIEREMKKIA